MKSDNKPIKEAVRKFLKAWSEGNYQEMYGHCSHTWTNRHDLDHLKKLFPIAIDSYRILGIRMTSNASVVRDFTIQVKKGKETYKITARTVTEAGAFMPDVNGDPGVYPNSIKIL